VQHLQQAGRVLHPSPELLQTNTEHTTNSGRIIKHGKGLRIHPGSLTLQARDHHRPEPAHLR